MARKVHVQLIDDLSGQDADETLRFSVDGIDYDIDLTASHAAELRGRLEKYLTHGRRLRGTSGPRAARTGPTSREETRQIRNWAEAHGYNPSVRGRISQEIRKAYYAAQG